MYQLSEECNISNMDGMIIIALEKNNIVDITKSFIFEDSAYDFMKYIIDNNIIKVPEMIKYFSNIFNVDKNILKKDISSFIDDLISKGIVKNAN